METAIFFFFSPIALNFSTHSSASLSMADYSIKPTKKIMFSDLLFFSVCSFS